MHKIIPIFTLLLIACGDEPQNNIPEADCNHLIDYDKVGQEVNCPDAGTCRCGDK